MASNAVATPGANPLAFMTKLSACVYTYRPTTSSPAPSISDSTSSQKPEPELIVLATWMGARDSHIAKYLLQYQALFPTAPILLLRSEPRHFISPSGNVADFSGAVAPFLSIFPELGAPTADTKHTTTPAKHPRLLIHGWSNGGAYSLYHLRCALALSASASRLQLQPQLQLPPYTLVLDSTPGTFRYRAVYRAFATGLTGIARWLAAPIFHALCVLYWLQHEIVGRRRTGPLALASAALNDGAAHASELRRTYVYGDADRLVHWEDVEMHAAAAEGKGFLVKTERFEGGQHVAHLRVDAGRYWRVVRETWEGVEGKLEQDVCEDANGVDGGELVLESDSELMSDRQTPRIPLRSQL